MRNLMIVLGLLAAGAGLADCLGSHDLTMQYRCAGIVFVSLAMLLVLCIVAFEEPRFGKISPEKIS